MSLLSGLFSKTTGFTSEVLSVQGLRDNNEDSCLSVRLENNAYFMGVADGMGGEAGGEIASKAVLKSVSEFLKKEIKNTDAAKGLKELLERSFLVAQTAIAEIVKGNPELQGMGTTLAAVLIKDNRYVWGNIGDSRVYLRNNNQLSLATRDHTYIEDFIRTHNKELPAAIIAQYSNIVTKIIDGGSDIPDIYPSSEIPLTLHEGDLFLLCSDGLIIDKTLDYSEFFEEMIYSGKSFADVAQNLVSWALENGSTDNISIVLGLYGNLKERESKAEMKTVRILPDEDIKSD
jgi:protein phosphatase